MFVYVIFLPVTLIAFIFAENICGNIRESLVLQNKTQNQSASFPNAPQYYFVTILLRK